MRHRADDASRRQRAVRAQVERARRRRGPRTGPAPPRTASSAIRAGSSTRSRRRACGSSTAPRDPARAPRRRTRRAPARSRPRSWNSSTRSVSAIAPADQATTVGGGLLARRRAAARAPARPTCPPATASAGRARQHLGAPRRGAAPPTGALRGPPPRRRTRPARCAHPREVPVVDEPDDGLGVGASARRAPAGRSPPRRATSRSAPSTPSSCTRCSCCSSASAARCARSASAYSRVPLQHVLPAGVAGARLTLRPSSSASSSASSGSRSCQPAVIVGDRARRGPDGLSSVGRRCGPSTMIMHGRIDHAACTCTVGPRRRACRAARRSRGGASARRRWPCSPPRPAASGCRDRAGARRSPTRRTRAWISSTPE